MILSVEVSSVQTALTAPLPPPPLSTRPSSQSHLMNGVDVELNAGFADSLHEQVCQHVTALNMYS